jgi:acetyl esterase/lipase
MRSRRITAAVLAFSLVLLSTSACGASDKSPGRAADKAPATASDKTSAPTARPSAVPTWPSKTIEYLPGRAADVYLPRSPRDAGAVVLLVPGGGWQAADRTGLGPLAGRLARAGIAAVNITYRTSADGVVFPAPVEDVACAAAFAAQRVATTAGHPVRLVILGHSAGAQLGALAALAKDRFRGACPYRSVTADGFVGISGPYDLRAVADVAVALFGVPPSDDVAAWREGDPVSWIPDAPRGLKVLLLHGDADTTVSPYQSEAFATALRRGGLTVQLRMIKGGDHLSVFQPSVVGAIVIAWVRDLASG